MPPTKFEEFTFTKHLKFRIMVCIFIILSLFLFVAMQLWYIQIVQGERFLEQSVNNRIRISKITAPRGKIVSSAGEIIVDNTPSFDLVLIPQDTKNIAQSLEGVADLLHLDMDLLKNRVERNRNRPPFKPVLLKKELSWEEMSLVLSRKTSLPGISIDVQPKRLYRFGKSTSHVLGYLGEVSREELSRDPFIGTSLGDMVGKKGLERWGEAYLRGTNGALKSEVDVFGNRINILAEIDPEPGCNIVVTINPFLQQKAYELLDGRTGSIFAMHPRTGDVIIFVSSPGFDPNLFSRGISSQDWSQLINDPFNPLLNRVIHSQQPPGSVFKILVALAALEENMIDVKTTFFCPGQFKLGDRVFRCWKRGGHGNMNMKDALVESCDVYFYNLALRMGIDTIADYAKRFGLGQPTGYAMDSERSGLVPCPEWKRRRTGVAWQRGETINVSIGQGDLLTTPIQITAAMSGILNRTFIPKPRIVHQIECDNHIIEFQTEKKQTVDLSEESYAFLIQSLKAVVHGSRGTGRSARIRDVSVGGKTGTSQVISRIFEEDEEVPHHFKTHAWFVSFAPVSDPEIVLCVLVEHGGGGGGVAAPIAKEIMESYFTGIY